MTKEELKELLHDEEVIEIIKDVIGTEIYNTLDDVASEFGKRFMCTLESYSGTDDKTGKPCKKLRYVNIAEVLDRISDQLSNLY